MHRLLQFMAPLGLFVLSGPASAQGFLSFHLTELDGLPSSAVYDVEFDRDGAAWFATRAGVARYDGVGWEVHDSQSGLGVTGGVHLLALGTEGELWAVGGGLRAELVCYRDGSWEDHGLVPQTLTDSSPVSLEVLPLEDGGQELLALGRRGNLLLHGEDGWSVVASGVVGMDLASEGLLLATERGLERYLPGGRIEPEVVAGLDGPLSGIDVVRKDDGTERCWVLGRDWLGHIEAATLTLVAESFDLGPHMQSGPPSIQADAHGGVWFGTFHELMLWDRGTLRTLDQRDGLVAGGASELALDGLGNMWIPTLRGVSRVPPRAWEVLDEDDGLLQSEVSAIERMGDGRLVLGHNGGLSLSGPDGWEHLSLDLWPGSGAQVARVLDLEPDGQGGLWVAANGLGFAHLSPDGVLEPVLDLHEAVGAAELGPAVSQVLGRDGVLWRLTNHWVLREEDGVIEPLAPPDRRRYMRRALKGPEGTGLYVCTSSSGVMVYEEGAWRHVPGRDSGENNVFTMGFPSTGPPLVGTMSGLRVLGAERLEPAPEGLRVGAPIFALLEDSRGWLWIGTARGVYRWDGARLEHFTVEDGLAGQEANRDALLELDDGRIAIGTSHGLAIFDPAREWAYPPPVPTVSGPASSSPDWTRDQPLDAGADALFTVELASLAGRGRPELRHRILGDEAWSEPQPAGDPRLRFASLDPGPFGIEVQARHEGADWGPVVASEVVEVHQVFWRSAWFLVVRVLVLGGFLAAGTALFLRGRQARRLEDELRRRTSALRRIELRFERLFAMNPAAQFLVEPDSGLVRHMNDAARRLLDAEHAAPTASSLEDVFEHLGASLSPEQLARVLEGLGAETQLGLTCEAVERDLELLSSRFALGDDDRLLVTLVDVTARRRLEERVRSTQSLQAVGELAGGLAHDFNNLLTAILGQVELLRAGVGSADRGEHLDSIEHAGNRGAALVRKLLAFGRRQPLNPEVVDLAPAVAAVLRTLGDLLGHKFQLESELDARGLFVRVDPVEIERVVLNLCLNARDAMPKGGRVRIGVDALAAGSGLQASEDDPRLGWVRLVVADDGVGLTPEVRARMFEPFYTTKSDPTGAGLGLASVHGVVGQSGGRVEVDGSPGRGTEVRVLLPRVEAPALDPEAPRERILPAASPLRVLLVEDQPEVRRAVGSLLRGLGHEPLAAGSGDEALEQLRAAGGAVDVVLTDVMMPGMDGLELAERLAGSHPGLPVVFMSGYLEGLEGAPQAPFLAKPFTVVQLQEALGAAPGPVQGA